MKNTIKGGLFVAIAAISLVACDPKTEEGKTEPVNSEVKTAEIDTNKAKTETSVSTDAKTEEGAKTNP